MRPQRIAKVNKIESKIYLTEILLIKTFELHKPNMYTSKKKTTIAFLIERAIFQTFWKDEGCAKFLFFELKTSNFGYLLIF